ncbi:alpha/beta hydrolase [Oleiagrimonas sp. C23AA]|uniref:alpha/beta fold hydrolase n=1 Tax=Oleiagrimonas sp. C23AA TaxID=2719047 RepID=UPI001422DB87|nr:alpha/beta hydrolase [Oleiagrimonas sp. C23AA]NII12106.1 alpha/beta hydrolase [Oleiagrimonas sp. C23AA]
MVALSDKLDDAPVRYLKRADGVRLAWRELGPRQQRSVLFAHGFGQTHQAWAGSMQALADTGMHCVGFDARGHGLSDRQPGGDYAMRTFIDDLDAMARAQAQPPVLIGASMGGLLGLAVAGECSSPPFSALVLVDITPRWRPEGVARILSFMRAYPDGFASLEEAAEAVAAYMPHRAATKTHAQLSPLLREGADGRLRWHWDPALLDTVAEQGEAHQPRLMEAARAIRMPVLLLSGGRSEVVGEDHVQEFMQLVPHARHVQLPAATHMVAGDANDAFTREITKFVRSLDGAGDTKSRGDKS